MGRTKGSKNKPKSNQPKSETPDVAQEPTPTQDKNSVATPPEVAPDPNKEGDAKVTPADGEPVGEKKKRTKKRDEPSDGGGMTEHKAPPRGADTIEAIPKLQDEIEGLWTSIRAEEEQRSADNKTHNDNISRYKGEIDSIYERINRIRLNDCEEILHFDRNIVEYKSRATGRVVRTRAMLPSDKQTRINAPTTVGNAPIVVKSPPRPTFSELREGKVWEHEVHGCVCVVALLEDEIRVRTEDLSEDSAGIKISKSDWDDHDAYPREVPDLGVGQKWRLKDTTVIITALDDHAACCEVATDQGDTTSDRRSRLEFCSTAANRIEQEVPRSVIVPGTIEVGQHYRLMSDDIPDGHRLVTVTAAGESVIEVRWAHTGLGGSVPRAHFDFAESATQEEIDAALVKPKSKGKKRGRQAEPEAAE